MGLRVSRINIVEEENYRRAVWYKKDYVKSTNDVI